MRQSQTKIVNLETVGPFVRARFNAPDLAPEPGRALLARTPDAYLRQTWWPCAVDADGFSILLDGAQAAGMRVGDPVDVLGPVGRGFRLDDAGRSWLLVAAGSTAPQPDVGPLLPLIDRGLAGGRAVTLAYATPDSDRVYPVAALPPAIEVVCAGSADLFERLPEAIAWADQIFACGPEDFIAQLADRVQTVRFSVPRGFAQALCPMALPCGVGVCGVCWRDARRACLDGPVRELTPRPRKMR